MSLIYDKKITWKTIKRNWMSLKIGKQTKY